MKNRKPLIILGLATAGFFYFEYKKFKIVQNQAKRIKDLLNFRNFIKHIVQNEGGGTKINIRKVNKRKSKKTNGSI